MTNNLISDDVKQAKDYLSHGNRKFARLILEAVIKRDPANENAYLLLVDCTDSISKRIQYLSKAIQLNPRNSSSRRYLDGLETQKGCVRRRIKEDDQKIGNLQKDKPKNGKKSSKYEKTKPAPENVAYKIHNPNSQRDENGDNQKPSDVISPEPEHISRSQEDDFFYGFQEGIDLSSRMETGMFGKTVVVDGIRFSLFDGPPCVRLDEPQKGDQCDSCDYFSPNNCLLRFDEFLLDDINRFAVIRSKRMEAVLRKRQRILNAIHKVLRDHGIPLHYQDITRIIMGRYPKFKLKVLGIYQYLQRHPELFERIGSGLYRSK